MIISRTPFRISFAGGGSDLREYYSEYGGAVLSTTINKYIFLSMHPYFYEKKFFLKYSQSELTNDVNDIKHPIIRQVFKDYKLIGVDFNSSADIPSGSGLASSSAFTAGLINLCNAYTGKFMSKVEIASYACDIEMNKLGEPIGKQDQYACAIGGINYIQFNQDETVDVEKIIITPEKYSQLKNNLLLFYLGGTRVSSSILYEQKQNTKNDKAKINNLHKMVSLAKNLREELAKSNIDVMGEILHSGWMYKKELASKITNSQIDYYYNLGIKNGAIGGKLLGAGGAGFMLFFVKDDQKERLRKSMTDLEELTFEFDNTGTTIIY